MPSWGEILKQLQAPRPPGSPPPFDEVRRRYLVELSNHTGRATILYATRFASPSPAPPDLLSINDEDLQGLMEVVHGISNPQLDLILHSPGGSLEAAEALVAYLRSKFPDIRAIVPSLALSAATMIACACNRILMGKHSFLGPIDPQFILNTPMGQRIVSADAILEQFRVGQRECQDPTKLGSWLPMLNQYGPDMLVKCQHAGKMSKSLVQGWLRKYMFGGDRQAKRKADKIATWLSKHRHFKSHGRHIPREELAAKGLVIDRLEDDQKLQDLVLSVFHATNHTFGATSAVKIVENHTGRAFIKTLGVPVQLPFMQPQVQIVPAELPPA